ncbi:hypothetical protein B296_00012427 [Ensete ventricosum]|uniref:Uncharacterized protein n=1 Tax=Ensete ventricosum TaxID=4639 RepID=A0A427AUV6_ENSVE|nr:hypothetical protein B296_00012427 [Ensete ventricosum]
MVDSDGETTISNGGVGADGGLPRPIEIEVGPSTSEGKLTFYSVIRDFLAGIVLPPPEASPPPAFLQRLKFSYSKASPCLREASRNSARDLLLWTRRGGSPRALLVIAVRWIGFMWIVWLAVKKSVDLARQSRVFVAGNIEVHIGRKPYLGSIYCRPLLIHRLDFGLGSDGDGIGHVQVPSAAPPPPADGRRRGRHLGRRRYRHCPLAHPGITEMTPVPVR